LADLASKIAMQRDVLYHGTRHAQSILTTGVLFHRDGDQMCSFTRSQKEAAYWALLERDNDEGRGSVFVLDRQSLKCRYKIEPFRFFNDLDDDDTYFADEAEETIVGDVTDVSNHLFGFVSDPATQSSVELAAQFRQLDKAVDRPQQMIRRHMGVEREIVEQRILFDLLWSHHRLSSCFSTGLNQRAFTVSTSKFFNRIGLKSDIDQIARARKERRSETIFSNPSI
jgi:hypothetical protein